MKTLLLLCCSMVAATVYSQDCQLQKSTDEFSGQPKISTGFMELQNVDLSIDATGKEIDYFFVIHNPLANCIGEESEAVFLLEGGKTKFQLRNSGGDNCNGYFHIIMKGGAYTPSAMQKLATKRVVSITFTDRNEKKTIVSLSEKEQALLMKASDCVAKEAKNLPR